MPKGTPGKILYINIFPDCRVEEMTLAGIRRYAGGRGWSVEGAGPDAVASGKLASLLRAIRPVGCIVECSGDAPPLPRRLFGRVPVVFCNGLLLLRASRIVRVAVDDAAVAKAAFRELSGVRPSMYAVIASRRKSVWSALRMEAFRKEVATAKLTCLAFGDDEPPAAPDTRARRLADWIAALPRRCAIFAVNDETAAEVVAASKTVHRSIPRELTLLGVDNDPTICENDHPSISSIQLDFERMGFLAARSLAARMTNRAARGMTTAVCAANDDALRAKDIILPLPPEAASSFADGGAVGTIGPMLAVRRESTRGVGRREPRILEAVEIIRREACSGLTAEELAKRFPGSRRHFERRFREAIGHSVLDEILNIRLENVTTYLLRRDVAIDAIAGLCGFGSEIELRRLFRRRFGMSMSDWRARNAV
jgi:LacI family transcriptional regulator